MTHDDAQIQEHILQIFSEASRLNKLLRDRSGKDRLGQQKLLQDMLYIQANNHPGTAAFTALGKDEEFRGAMAMLIAAVFPDAILKDGEKTAALTRCITALVIAGLND